MSRRKRTQIVTYNDTKMRERTLVHPDGTSLHIKRTVTTSDPKWAAFLFKHPEFEKV